MYIAPSTNVRILKNCPLNVDYQDTIYFENLEKQKDYFMGLTKYRLNNQSYQRVNSNTMRVQLKVENLYDCNYIMFQNESFGEKWFYGFITNVEYVNNITTEISYIIDVMQTWFFDYELLPSFIVREHSATDVIGENTIPENLETGTYITTQQKFYSVCDNPLIVVMSATQVEDENNEPIFAEPQRVLGYPLTCYWVGCGEIDGRTSLTQQLNILDTIIERVTKAGKVDAIIGIFIYDLSLGTGTGSQVITFNGAERTLPTTPKNKKLYTYPYCCNVLVGDGQSVELKYELFENQNAVYNIRSTFGANYKAICNPVNYEGMSTDLLHAVSIGNMPVLPFIRDYFQNWWAQNGASTVYGTIPAVGKFLGGVGKAFTPTSSDYYVRAHGVGINKNILVGETKYGNMKEGLGQAVEGAYEIGSTLVKVYEQSIIPDSLIGVVNASDTMYFSGLKGFYSYCRTIRPEYIKIIDDYFDRYGYETHVNKVPNRAVRPHWTYTKTAGCNIKGEMPQSAINQIISIYNKGITFWKKGDEIGNYNLDNTV